MTKQHFSFKEIFMFGWAKTKQHAWFIALTTIIISIIMSAAKTFTLFKGELVQSFDLYSIFILLLVCLSVVSISLLISRDHHFTFSDLFSPLLSPKKVLKFFAITAILAIPIVVLALTFVVGVFQQNAVVTILGMILFLPLVYLSVCFKLFPFVVLEHENASVVELMTITYNLTAPHFLQMFAFLVLATILNVAGAIVIIGLFVTVPVTLFATAHVYDKLKEHSM